MVPAGPPCRALGAPNETSTCGATRRTGTPTCASSSRTPRRRTGHGILSPGRTTGIGSSPTSPTSTTTTRSFAKPITDVLGFWLDLGVDGLRLDAVPYLFERDGTNGENLPETHEELKRLARSWTRTTRIACSSLRRTSGRRTRSRTSATATSATWRSTSRSCPGCTCRSNEKTGFRSSTSSSRPRDSRRCPVGDLPPESRRTHARDGVRGGARPDVADATPRTAGLVSTLGSVGGSLRCSRTTGGASSCCSACSCRCPVRRCSTTATRSGWATTSSSPTATAFARRCNGATIAMPASRAPTRSRSICPIVVDPQFHYETVNVEAQQANPNSLLSWTRGMIRLRQRHPVFGRGSIEFLVAGQRTDPRLPPRG